jgi:hypothetical protein
MLREYIVSIIFNENVEEDKPDLDSNGNIM